MPPIADNIRSLMKARGLSVASLAEASAIPRSTLSRRLVDPAAFTLTELGALAGALSVDPFDLLLGKAAA